MESSQMQILAGLGIALIGLGVLLPALSMLRSGRDPQPFQKHTLVGGAVCGMAAGAVVLATRPVLLMRVAQLVTNRAPTWHALAWVLGAGAGAALAALALTMTIAMVGSIETGIAVLILGAVLQRLAGQQWRYRGNALAGFGALWVGAGLMMTGLHAMGSLHWPHLEYFFLGMVITVLSRSRLPAMTLAFAALTATGFGVHASAWGFVGMECAMVFWALMSGLNAKGVLRSAWSLQALQYCFVAVIIAFVVALGPALTPLDLIALYSVTHLGVVAVALLGLPALARSSFWANQTLTEIDPTLHDAPEAALAVARSAILAEAQKLFALLGRGLGLNSRDISPDTLDRIRLNLRQLQIDTEAIATQPGSAHQAFQLDLLQALDHLDSVRFRAMQHDRIATARTAPSLAENGRKLGRLLRDFPASGGLDLHAERCDALRHDMHEFRLRHRADQIGRVAQGEQGPATLALTLDSARWMQRMSDHAWNITHLLQGQSSEPTVTALRLH
ncbi:MAG: hypothetical protein JXR13_17950 [Thalassovita sp.]